MFDFFLSSLEELFIDLRETGRGRERNIYVRETYWSGVSHTCPNQGQNPQLRQVPWPGINLQPFGYRKMLPSTELLVRADSVWFKWILEGTQKKPRNLFIKNCVFILTWLNFSYLQSTLHLMQYTYETFFHCSEWLLNSSFLMAFSGLLLFGFFFFHSAWYINFILTHYSFLYPS